jgi:mono/diheme cytochrome c family protein
LKKLLKIIGIVIGAFLIIVLIGFLYFNFKSMPTYEAQIPEFEHTSSPEILDRGEKLATMLCAGCHSNEETGLLTGNRMIDAPPEFGMIYAPNITQDPTYGIGTWTDGEILYLMRTGIKRDGSYAPPYMAKLPQMADDDINAIIAFLRSDDQRVAANPTPDQPCEPSALTKFLSTVAWTPLPMPEGPIPMPDELNSVELGKYLAHNLDCFSCHSADFSSNNFLDPEQSVGYFGGGNKPLNKEGVIMYTSNLTPDSETGIGNWSKKQFVQAVKYGIKEGEPALQFPMMPYVQLTDYEAGAIYDYLMTIPPIKNDVTRTSLMAEGK